LIFFTTTSWRRWWPVWPPKIEAVTPAKISTKIEIRKKRHQLMLTSQLP